MDWTRIWDQLVKLACAALGAVAGLFGGWSAMMTVLAACMGIDYATGVLAACAGRSPKSAEGGVSSQAGFRGLARKAVILLVVGLAALVDRAAGTTVLLPAAQMYYIANEGISILENAVIVGVPVPDALRNALEVMRERKEERAEPGGR